MQEEKRPQGDGVTPTKEDAERDATSKETVSELGNDSAQQSESGSGSSGIGESSSGATPSPDGQFDGTRDGAAGPGEETGPM